MHTSTTTDTRNEFATNKAWSGRGTLEQLVGELDRQVESRLDVVADSRALTLDLRDGNLFLVPGNAQTREWLPREGMMIRDKVIPQLCERLTPGVPTKFFRKLVETRDNRALELANGLLADCGKKRLVRTLDGQVRAFLSNSYRVIDNYDIAVTALDTAREQGADVLEASLSDTRMHLKLINRNLWEAIDDVRQNAPSSKWYTGGLGDQGYLKRVAARTDGDLPGGPGTVHPVVTVSNSETGHGTFHVRIGILQAICFNLATVEKVAKEIHLGGAIEEGIYSDETISLDSQAVMLKARDSVRAAFQPETFARIVALANEAQADPIKNTTEAVNHLVKNASLSEEAKNDILGHFLRDYTPDGHATRYGLAQAVARHAQTYTGADEADDIESLSGQLITSNELITA